MEFGTGCSVLFKCQNGLAWFPGHYKPLHCGIKYGSRHNMSISNPGITCWKEGGVPEVEGLVKWDDPICTNLYNDTEKAWEWMKLGLSKKQKDYRRT